MRAIHLHSRNGTDSKEITVADYRVRDYLVLVACQLPGFAAYNGRADCRTCSRNKMLRLLYYASRASQNYSLRYRLPSSGSLMARMQANAPTYMLMSPPARLTSSHPGGGLTAPRSCCCVFWIHISWPLERRLGLNSHSITTPSSLRHGHGRLRGQKPASQSRPPQITEWVHQMQIKAGQVR